MIPIALIALLLLAGCTGGRRTEAPLINIVVSDNEPDEVRTPLPPPPAARPPPIVRCECPPPPRGRAP